VQHVVNGEQVSSSVTVEVTDTHERRLVRCPAGTNSAGEGDTSGTVAEASMPHAAVERDEVSDAVAGNVAGPGERARE
jgi:hypothetical protein